MDAWADVLRQRSVDASRSSCPSAIKVTVASSDFETRVSFSETDTRDVGAAATAPINGRINLGAGGGGRKKRQIPASTSKGAGSSRSPRERHHPRVSARARGGQCARVRASYGEEVWTTTSVERCSRSRATLNHPATRSWPLSLQDLHASGGVPVPTLFFEIIHEGRGVALRRGQRHAHFRARRGGWRARVATLRSARAGRAPYYGAKIAGATPCARLGHEGSIRGASTPRFRRPPSRMLAHLRAAPARPRRRWRRPPSGRGDLSARRPRCPRWCTRWWTTACATSTERIEAARAPSTTGPNGGRRAPSFTRARARAKDANVTRAPATVAPRESRHPVASCLGDASSAHVRHDLGGFETRPAT